MNLISKPEIHPKGWGHETWIVNCPDYCGKILEFRKGGKCSFHKHLKKKEHFYVLKGRFLLKTGWDKDINKAKETILEPGDVVEIPRNLIHQLIAIEDGQLLEISTQHFEDDSYRYAPGDSQTSS